MSKREILCLTPIKNEAWILKRFLDCAALWADRIIILDQGSDDGSSEIIKLFGDKIIYRDIGEIVYDEGRIRGELLELARGYSSNALLFAIDADEVLSSAIFNSSIHQSLDRLTPGSVLSLPLVNLLPGGECCWIPTAPIVSGFVDDGSMYCGDWIHTPRFDIDNREVIYIEAIKLLHYQYVDWNRMRSKHRWYQLEEGIQNPSKSSVAIYRRYHHMDNLKTVQEFPKEYIDAYCNKGIDLTNVPVSKEYRWDVIVRKELSKPEILRRSRYLDVFDGLELNASDWSDEARNRVIAVINNPQRKFMQFLLKWGNRNPYRLLQRTVLKLLSMII